MSRLVLYATCDNRVEITELFVIFGGNRMVEATQTKIRRVAVLGASGRMGSEAVKAITDAADLELVAA